MLPDLAVIILSQLLYSIISYLILPKRLPFSEPFPTAAPGRISGVTLLLLIILAAIAGVHLLLRQLGGPYAVGGYAVLLAGVNWLAWKHAFRGGRPAASRLEAGAENGGAHDSLGTSPRL